MTHHVSVIVIQAGGAKQALDSRPEEARGALEAVDATARMALTEPVAVARAQRGVNT